MVDSGKVWTVVQARIRSDRMPGKVLATIGGRTMLTRVMGRVERIDYPYCLAIPHADTELAQIALANDWLYIEGSEEDVLERYVDAARAVGADHIIRVTADCPFLDVEAARWTVAHHLATGADFTHHFAEGRGVEVFTREALEDSHRLAPPEARIYREHPDEWILHHRRRYKIELMKFSVDTEADLRLARKRVGTWKRTERSVDG